MQKRKSLQSGRGRERGRGKNGLSCIFQQFVPQGVVVGVAVLKGATAAVAATVAARVATM